MNEAAIDSAKQRWALVTGASAGIGAEFCRQLAGLNYSLVLVARRSDRLQQLAQKLAAEHAIACRCFSVDLAEADAGFRLEEFLQDEGITISFLVNNAGYGVPGTFNQSDWPTHQASLQVMLNSVCELAWRFLPGMQSSAPAYIVNVASLAGLVPGSARHTLYSATKAFLIKFSQSLAMENLHTGVSVSALCPGFTYSEFHDVTGTRELMNEMSPRMWMTSKDVVAYGITSVMQKKPRIVAVPGRLNRFIALMAKLLPLSVTQVLLQRESRKWRQQDQIEGKDKH